MANTELIQKIEHAQDKFGVITSTALHDQLGTLTAADWKEAAAVYSKTSTTPGGFYIEDESGKITIHNDLKHAHEVADQSVFAATLEDTRGIGATVVALDGIMASSSAFSEWYGFSAEGVMSFGGSSAAAALAAGWSTAVFGGEVLGAIGAVAAVGDLGRNYLRKSEAQEDIRGAAELTV